MWDGRGSPRCVAWFPERSVVVRKKGIKSVLFLLLLQSVIVVVAMNEVVMWVMPRDQGSTMLAQFEMHHRPYGIADDDIVGVRIGSVVRFGMVKTCLVAELIHHLCGMSIVAPIVVVEVVVMWLEEKAL